MPYASAEGRNVDLIVVQRIGNHPMRPLEVKSGNTGPMQPAVCRSPGRRFKAGRVEHIGVLRINSDVVNVAILVEHLLPALAAILREKYPSAVSVFSGRSTGTGHHRLCCQCFHPPTVALSPRRASHSSCAPTATRTAGLA